MAIDGGMQSALSGVVGINSLTSLSSLTLIFCRCLPLIEPNQLQGAKKLVVSVLGGQPPGGTGQDREEGRLDNPF